MYNVSETFLNAVNADERTMSCRLDFGDFNIMGADIKNIAISQAIGTSDFEIGTVNAAKLDVKISAEYNEALLNKNYKNYKASVYIGIDTADGNIEVPMGIFKPDTTDIEDKHITLQGYDVIAQTDIPYVPADIYPNTLRAVAEDVCALCELELASDGFCNDDLIIDNMPNWGDITCRTALSYIAEVAGGCWIADRYGRLKLVTYATSVVTIDASMYYSLKVAESDFSGINSIYVISNDKELAWSINGEAEYSITDNPLVADKATANDALVNLKSILSHTAYRPFEMDYIGNPALDIGDGITITDTDGHTYTSVVCSQVLSYDGGLRCNMAAYVDESITDRGSQNKSYGEKIKIAQKTATQANDTAEEAKKTADEAKATLDNLPEIGVNIVNTNVIKSDVMQATWCFSKYMLVQFMETNFEALDVNQQYKKLRKYARIFDDNFKLIEAELSDSEVEVYKDPNGQKLYWTAVTGENAFKFFTYTSPLTIAASERPDGMSDEDFEALYTVKVRKTVAEYVKCSLGFPLNDSGTGEPELVFGTGDADGNGKYRFVKDADSGRFVYTSRTDGKEYGVAIKDDGVYQVSGEVYTKLYPMAVVSDVSQADSLPVGTLVFVGAIGG
jgi:hypothetical protein